MAPIKLVLKGSDSALAHVKSGQVPSRLDNLLAAGSVELMNESMSSQEMALLYAAADVYVSPYKAEGFNLPVLEAASVGELHLTPPPSPLNTSTHHPPSARRRAGTPVITTQGGPTDEFTQPEFALYVKSEVVQLHSPDRPREFADSWALEPNRSDLARRMRFVAANATWRGAASAAAAAHIHSSYVWPRITEKLKGIIAGGHPV